MTALAESAKSCGVADIDVDVTGDARLHLDGQPVNHVATRPSVVIRVLLDYASTLGTELIVTTRHADGRHAGYQVSPSGTVIASPHEPASPGTADHDRECRRHGSTSRRAGSRSRAVTRRSWVAPFRWIAAHGEWLMLCTLIVLLIGCYTFIFLALYMWSPS